MALRNSLPRAADSTPMSFPSFSFDLTDAKAYDRPNSEPERGNYGSDERRRKRSQDRARDTGRRLEGRRERSRERDSRDRRGSRENDADLRVHGSKRKRKDRSKSRSRTREGRQLDSSGTVFKVERRPDPYNLLYSGPDRGAVPRFKRAGGGRVPGAPDHLRFLLADKRDAKSEAPIRDKKTFGPDKRFSALRDSLRDPAFRLLKPQGSTTGTNAAEDFIALDDDVEDNISAEMLSEQQQIAFKTESEALARKLEQNEREYETWKALLDLQDKFLPSGSSKSAAYRAVVGEKKLAICEKALQALPQCDELWLDYLQIGESLWDTPTLLTNWDKALKALPMSARVWMAYLDFRQTNAATFTCTDCIAVFSTFLQTPTPREAGAARALVRTKIRAFIRACFMLREAGYVERAIAAIQAILEIAFRWPRKVPRRDWQAGMASFEVYFEGPAPRFGEAGSTGWARYDEATEVKQSNPAGAQGPAPKDPDLDDESEYSWWENERTTEEKSWLPQRAESLAQDPNAVVVLDDIQPLLFPIDSDASRTDLIVHILRFFGIPVSLAPSTSADLGFDDAFLANAIGHRTLEPSDSGGFILDAKIVPSYPQAPDYLFSRERPFVVVEEALFRLRTLRSNGALDFVRNMLSQLLADGTGDAFMDSWLAAVLVSMDFCASPKRGTKLAKQLLKPQRNNLSLWYAYAAAERAFGNTDDARAVLMSAIQLGTSGIPTTEYEMTALFSTLLHLEVSAGRWKAALSVTVHYALNQTTDGGTLGQEPSPPQVLKARKMLAERAFEIIQEVNRREVRAELLANDIRTITMRMWLEYLSDGYEAAIGVSEAVIDALKASSGIRCAFGEMLLQEYLRFLCFFRDRSSIAPSGSTHLTKVVELAVSHFPRNTGFLELYFEGSNQPGASARERWLLDLELKRWVSLRSHYAQRPGTGYTKVFVLLRENSSFFLASYPVMTELKTGGRNANAVRTLLTECLDRAR